MKKLTMSEAIRTFCLQCVGGVKEEVEICSAVTCPLYKFRLGANKSILTSEK